MARMVRWLLERFIPARAGNTDKAVLLGAQRAVHPRSRGEHAGSRPAGRRSPGSSPLARGTPQPLGAVVLAGRFIPARAGNTSTCSTSHAARSVHPRSRGEHGVVGPERCLRCGSSPLARGTLHDHHHEGDSDRFIPARAGNTADAASSSTARTVHPRSRGEHVPARVRRPHQGGSSPLARGTRRSAAPRIPVRPVHPRSRGEHQGDSRLLHVADGSSPLARGTLHIDRPRRYPQRFIPARAGNTLLFPAPIAIQPVHPRSRGEHGRLARAPVVSIGSSPLARGTRSKAWAPAVMLCGSSPLARGTPAHGELVGLLLRFIPARAGNTQYPRRPDPADTVHPRSRGEHRGSRSSRRSYAGSSPLARGTPPETPQ